MGMARYPPEVALLLQLQALSCPHHKCQRTVFAMFSRALKFALREWHNTFPEPSQKKHNLKLD